MPPYVFLSYNFPIYLNTVLIVHRLPRSSSRVKAMSSGLGIIEILTVTSSLEPSFLFYSVPRTTIVRALAIVSQFGDVATPLEMMVKESEVQKISDEFTGDNIIIR